MPPSQWGNVGNVGDTLKHAPIPDLIDVLGASCPVIAYLDPFAFALEAPLSPRVGLEDWRADLQARCHDWPAYKRHRELQEPRLLIGGPYRCGIGLALDAIGVNRLSWLLVAERDPALRGALETGLGRLGMGRGLVGGIVQSDAAAVPRVVDEARVSVSPGQGLFALIDPFTVASSPWAAILDGLERVLHAGGQAIVLAFNHQARDYAWPVDLTPAVGLRQIRSIREGPFHIVAYATGNLAPGVAGTLDRYGWRTPPGR